MTENAHTVTTKSITLRSPVKNVTDEAWSAFVRVMMVAPFEAVCPERNALGAFEIMPRRLADLGILRNLRRKQSKKSGKTIWVGKFIETVTPEFFLKHPGLQYSVFCGSMLRYAKQIESGEIPKPADMSLSGALAILHRAGPGGLQGKRFPKTQALFERAEGLF